MTAVHTVSDLLVESRDSGRTLVGPVDLALLPGGILGLVGESGSGKTLTLRALAGIAPEGLRVRHRHGPFPGLPNTAIVFQDPMGFFNPRWRISRSLREVLRVVSRVPKKDVETRTYRILGAVGLSREDATLFPFEMSGGMIQRASIAMALAVEPRILLADEVTSALDPETRDMILELLCRVGQERNVSTVIVSHDITSVVGYTDYVVVLYEGRVVEEGLPEQVLLHPRHRYTDLLVRSRPGRDTRGGELPEIPRGPVDDGEPAAGKAFRLIERCSFAPRCPAADNTCHSRDPAWSGEKDHRYRCFHPASAQQTRGTL